MSVMGERVDYFTIPVCNKFTPTVVEGQMCYQVDVNQFRDQVEFKQGKKNGLTFLMDYNAERMVDTYKEELTADQNLDDIQFIDENGFEARIYIDTIGRYNFHKKLVP